MKQSKFPAGWDEARIRRIIDHYEKQTEEDAAAEDEPTSMSEPSRRSDASYDFPPGHPSEEGKRK